MKQVLAILTVITMTVCLLTTGVMAAETPEADAHIHTFAEPEIEIQPTCLTEGITVSRCTAEGECDLPAGYQIETAPVVDCQAAEERLGQRDASCLLEGCTGSLVCKWCLTVLEEGETIPKLDHTLGEWVVNETMNIRYQTCDTCKLIVNTEEITTEPEEPEAAHTHIFEEPLMQAEATCRTEGITVSVCTAEGKCDLPARYQIEKTAVVECQPAEERAGQFDASCLLEGYTGNQVCKWCLTLLEEGETIPKTAHTPGEWIEDDILSIRYQICDSCKLIVNTEEIPEEPEEPEVVELPFTDVAADAYYYDSVVWAVENGITSGTTATNFSPNLSCTRGQVVTFLWRSAGSPEPVSDTNPFSDVAEDAYYYKAVLWAVGSGITSGTSPSTFSPEESCTRAQVVTFLWRSAGSPDSDKGLDLFIDVTSDDYFHTAVIWAAQNDITGGTSFFMFSPDNPCTRAQIVTFLYKASLI